jgi:hypothetical protein
MQGICCRPREMAMLRKRKEPEARKSVAETLLQDMQPRRKGGGTEVIDEVPEVR